jgi:formylglycine-generating enzyme required for sulfatase activity
LHTFGKGKESYPVAHVDYFKADAFCKHGGNRLPSEKEWEKSARGVDGRKWPWENYVEHPNNGFSGFIPEDVDKRKGWISPYGIYGMGHNVWEWTQDDYAHKGMTEKNRGIFKVIRGGVLQTHLSIKFSPTYFRNWMEPGASYNFIGFRCARSVY